MMQKAKNGIFMGQVQKIRQSGKRVAFWATLLVSSVVVFYFAIHNTKLSQMTQVQEGVGTCFARANQSFTAYMLQDLRSAYLTPDFMDITSECFGEVIDRFETVFGDKDRVTVKALNDFVTGVFSFHGKLNQGKNEDNDTLVQTFERLEEEKGVVLELIDEHKVQAMELNQSLEYLLGLCFFALSFMTFLSFRKQKVVENQKNQFEHRAKKFLRAGDYDFAKVAPFIKESLEFSQLPYCSQLSYKCLKDAEATQAYQQYHQLRVPETAIEQPKLQGLNLGRVVDEVLLKLSNKIFAKEVIFDSRISEKIVVESSEEPLFQLMFELLSYFIDLENIASKREHNKILLKAEEYGQDIVFTIHKVFNIQSNSEIEISLDENRCDVVTKMGQEFMNDFGGEFFLKNMRNSDGIMIGQTIELVVSRSEQEDIARPAVEALDNGREMVSLIKGKKRDISKQMRQGEVSL